MDTDQQKQLVNKIIEDVNKDSNSNQHDERLKRVVDSFHLYQEEDVKVLRAQVERIRESRQNLLEVCEEYAYKFGANRDQLEVEMGRIVRKIEGLYQQIESMPQAVI